MLKNLFKSFSHQKSAWLKFGVCMFMIVILIYAFLTSRVNMTVIGFVLLGLGLSLDGLSDLLSRRWHIVSNIVRIFRVVFILGAFLCTVAALLIR